MTHCKECGANEKGTKLIVDDFESYEICNVCEAEDSIIEINEDEFEHDREVQRRISAWKEEK